MKIFGKMSKILSLLLALCMVITLVPAVGFAAQTESGLCDGDDDLIINADNRSVKPQVYKVAGDFGKAEDDMIYQVVVNAELDSTAKYGTGYNFLKLEKAKTLDTNVSEFSFFNSGDVDFQMEAGVFKEASTSAEWMTAPLLKIIDGEVTVGTKDGVLADESEGAVLATLNEGEWVNLAFVVPGYNSYEDKENFSNKTIYIYINGVKKEINFASDFYGLRHIRFSPIGNTGETKTFYLDNVRSYLQTSTAYYEEAKDALPVVDFGKLNMSGKTILADDGITVNQLAQEITTTATMRVYEDATYKTLLTGDDYIPFGAIVVFGEKNGYSTERSFAYYTVGQMAYEEPNLYEGTKDLVLGADNRSVKPTVTEVGGVYGKDKNDMVYKVDVNTEKDTTAQYNVGYNFLSVDSSKKLDTTTGEFSFLNPGDVNFTLAMALFLNPTTTDNVDVTNEDGTTTSVTNRVYDNILTVTDGEVRAGTGGAFITEDSGKLLGTSKAGEWTSIAIVLPGYNSNENKDDFYDNAENYVNRTIYVYVNGVGSELTLKEDYCGVRHIRFAPVGKTGDTKTFYFDNIRRYVGTDEAYDAKKDALPTVDLSLVDVYEDNITVAKGTTVKDLKDSVKTNATVRVFTDPICETQLGDEDELSLGNVIVFATMNSRTTERAYTYYSVNNSVQVRSVKLTNADGKIIRGTQADIENIGETYYLETVVSNKSAKTNATLKAIAVSYNAEGKMVDFAEKSVIVAPGTTQINATTNAVNFEEVETPAGGTLKAFLWTEDSNRPLCKEFSTVFDGLEEYSVLAYGNSYSEDAFSLLPTVAKAAGIDIYAVNMYRGGCPLSTHYKHMNGDGVYQTRVEYLPDGTNKKTTDVSFIDGLNTPGYTWDYISLQSRSVEAYDFDYFEPYVAAIADYIRENSPSSEVFMHQTWVLDTDTAKTKTHTQDLVADLSDEQIRPYLFSLLKQNYTDAAELIGNPNRIVPVGEAVNYAVGTLGFAEYVTNEDGTYDKYGRGMYRDTTCHLSLSCGRVLAALTWYEYITGHDARENPYENSYISAEDMALLKEAAHWACSQADYIQAQ